MSPTQYLGMAESDFYLLAESGNFGQNYMKGLFGIWLQSGSGLDRDRRLRRDVP